MQQILFVCNTNRISSKMAAAYLERKLSELEAVDYEVISAGLAPRRGDGMPQAAMDALAELGLKSRTLEAAMLTLKEIKTADLIACLSLDVEKKILDRYQSARGKTINLLGLAGEKRDVFEPRSNLEACRNCLSMMRPALDVLASRLAK